MISRRYNAWLWDASSLAELSCCMNASGGLVAGAKSLRYMGDMYDMCMNRSKLKLVVSH